MPLRITLAYAPAPREVFEQELELPDGACAREAVQASQLEARFPALDRTALSVGVWGRAVEWDQALSDGDRLELFRSSGRGMLEKAAGPSDPVRPRCRSDDVPRRHRRRQ